MATGETSGAIHPDPTQRSGHRYLFYEKHHGRGGPDAAQWLPDLSRDDEFAVFNAADLHDISDERNWLYGVRIDADGKVLFLGTAGQQIAEFPFARPNEPWHGYPHWPLKDAGPENRRGEKLRPSKSVFLKLEAANLLTTRDRKRLFRRKHT
jgi:hypothetical protein